MNRGYGIRLHEKVHSEKRSDVEKTDKYYRKSLPGFDYSTRKRMGFGILLMLISLTAGFYFYNHVSAKIPILVAAKSLSTGQIVSLSDVAVDNISTSDHIIYIPVTGLSKIIGKRTNHNILSGSVLSYADFTSSEQIPQGYSLVGLALKTGQYPVGRLFPGEIVSLVATPSDFSFGQSNLSDTGLTPGEIVDSQATVIVVDQVTSQSSSNYSLLLTVAVPNTVAGEVGLLSASGDISIIATAQTGN